MSDDLIVRSGARQRAGRMSSGRVRWGARAISGGVLVLATVMGVRLGLDAPAVSPVSPAALAARYGAPPTEAPGAPPIEAAAIPPTVATAGPLAEAAAVDAAAVPVAPPAASTALSASDAIVMPSTTTTAAASTAATAQRAAAAVVPPVEANVVPSSRAATVSVPEPAMQPEHQRGQREGGGHD